MNEVKSLARGLQILELLRENGAHEDVPQGVSITELAEALNVNKSSASRLVRTLGHYGYVQRDHKSRGYVIGPKLTQPRPLSSRSALRDLARPFLYQLMTLTGECAHTAIYTHGQVLIIDDVESSASLRVSGGTGRVEDLHCTAVGKCLLAFMDIALPEHLPKHTVRTITNTTQLCGHLEEIRLQGYAFDDEENIEGVRCLATPVFDHTNKTIGCIGISGPTIRMTATRVQEFAALLIKTSRELSVALGKPESASGSYAAS